MSSLTASAFGDIQADVARRKLYYAQWRRRSGQIKFYRRALPALIAFILLGMGLWILAGTISLTPKAADANLSIRMMNPKFYGRGSDNLPYVITAASATRDERDFQRVVLEMPVFTNHLGLPTETMLKSRYGVYRENTGELRLEKDLVVIDKRGYNFNTQQATVDTKTGLIDGKSPIDGLGPLGRIAASSYAVTRGGERVIFRGNVRTRIDRPTRAASAPAVTQKVGAQ